MARVREDNVQVKLRINGKEAVDTLADLNKRYRDANKELRQLTIGSDEFVEKQKEIADLKNIIQQNREEIKQFQQAVDEVSPRSILSLSKQAKTLREEIEKLEPGTDQFISKAQELDIVEQELEAAKKEAGLLGDRLEDLDPKSLDGLTQKTKELRAELGKLVPGTEAYRKKLKELGDAEKELEKVQSGLNKASKGTTGLRGAFSQLNNFLKASVLGLILTVTAGIVNAFRQAGEGAQEMQKLREELNLTTGETGDQLDRIAARTKATSEVYQVEIDKVKDSSFAAAQAFNTGYDQILDLTRKGLDATGSKGEEFLDQVGEYSVQFEKLGFSAEESFGIIARAINDGTFLDKGADAIKEFDLRITNLTKGQKETLENAFGKDFTDRITEGIETGKITSREALSEISKGVGDLGKDTVQAKRVVSELFGAPGEDVGADFIISLQNTNNSLDSLIDTSNIYYQQRQELLELEDEAAAASAELSRQFDQLGGELSGVGNFFREVGLRIKTGFLDTLANSVEFIRYIPSRFEIFKVRTLEQINNLVSNGSDLLNFLVTPIRELTELLGFEFPEIKLPTFEVDTSAEELQKQLQNRIAQDRKDFADKQKREALAASAGQAAAERQQQLQQQQQAERQRREALERIYAEERKITEQAMINIQQLKISLIEDEAQREIELRQFQTARKIQALQGNEELIKQQTILLKEELYREVERIESEAFAQRILSRQIEANEEISQLQGSQEQILNERIRIEQLLISDLSTIQEEYISKRKTRIEEQAQLEVANLTGTSEEIQEATTRIYQRRDQEIEELESNSFRKQIERIESSAVSQEEKLEQIQALKKKVLEEDLFLTEANRKAITASDDETYQQRLTQLQKHQAKKKLEITRAVLEEAEAGEITEDLDAELQRRLTEQQKQFLEDKLKLNEEFGVDEVDIHQEIEDLKFQATKERLDKEAEALKKADEKRKRRREELIAETAELLNNLQALNQTVLDSQVSKLQETTDQRVGIIAQEEQIIQNQRLAALEAAGDDAEQKEEIEKEYTEKLQQNVQKREQAEREAAQRKADLEQKSAIRRRLLSIAQKTIALRDVYIETARSIAKTGGDLGYPAALPFQVVAAVIGARQAAAIIAQRYEKGKKPGPMVQRGKGGLPQGPSHQDGGIKLVDSKTRQVVGEMEGNEPILSTATYFNNKEIVDKLLFTSMHRGGAPIFQDGGILNTPSTTPTQELIQQTAQLSDTRIVQRLISLEQAVKDLTLHIGEEGAVAIDRMVSEYKTRIGIN